MSGENDRLAVVILAAGMGKRMMSETPKVLHRVCGRPLLEFALLAAAELHPAETLAVVGSGADRVADFVGGRARCVEQQEQRGTGHAAMVALQAMGDGIEEVLVLPGDSPLLVPETLRRLVEVRRSAGAAASMLTAVMADPSGYGRVLRNAGRVTGIVEEADASEDERSIHEVNACTYGFSRGELADALGRLTDDNAQGEYYLTDVVGHFTAAGLQVVAVQGSPEEALGVNDREQLARVGAICRERINRELMLSGVGMSDPDRTYVDFGVEVGRDTVIMPLVFLKGRTRIGPGCRIGPCTEINDSTVGERCEISFSWVDGCEVEDAATVGPYSRLRPGCVIGPGAKVGSFVEMKKTRLGKGSKVPHLSYIGDADIGDDVNVGAGTITCNYDGEEKHQTTIGDRAFIGSDTMLIAPVNIGADATTAAGSAIAEDVPEGALGIERGEQKNIAGWRRKRKRRGEKP